MSANNTACRPLEEVKQASCSIQSVRTWIEQLACLREYDYLQVGITLYGAARVVIGQSQMDLAFDSLSVTLGEVLEKIIALYPRAQPYLLDESGRLPLYIRVLINEVRPDPDATPATLLHDHDRVILLVAVAGGER